MNIIKIELILIILVIVIARIIIYKENLIIESKLELIKDSLNYLTKYISDYMNLMICKKQSEAQKQLPHLNRDDIDDEGWRKP